MLCVCIYSDCVSCILRAVRKTGNGFVQPLDVHMCCLFHVINNLSRYHVGGELKNLIWLAGTTSHVRKCETYMKRTVKYQYLFYNTFRA